MHPGPNKSSSRVRATGAAHVKILLFLLTLAIPVFAQSDNTQISGFVKD